VGEWAVNPCACITRLMVVNDGAAVQYLAQFAPVGARANQANLAFDQPPPRPDNQPHEPWWARAWRMLWASRMAV